MQINFTDKITTAEATVFLFKEGKALKDYKALKAIDTKEKGTIATAIKNTEFKGKKAEVLKISTLSSHKNLILLGTGKSSAKDSKFLEFSKIGSDLFILTSKYKSVSFVAEGLSDEQIVLIANGFTLRSYEFNEYKTENKESVNKVEKISFLSTKAKESEKLFATKKAVIDGVFLARNVISHPSNNKHPAIMAKEFKKLEKNGAKVHVFDMKALEKMGANLIVAVGKGSEIPPYMVVVEYNGGKKGQAPLAIVGKGITFDTGGYAIKPADGMEWMKYDMSGSAAVLGIMKSIIDRKLPINVVGAVALAENMVSGNAVKPGDIVTSLSGLTVEIINPDAEGRLVLGDVLYYVHSKYKPKHMIDLATLTGACTIALGNERAGLMSNDDSLASALFKSGEYVGEKLWSLPMDEEYLKVMVSDIADLRNIPNARGAGVQTAAKFLEKFVSSKKGGTTSWAHLDIAGKAWNHSDKPLCPKGAVGFGVLLLNQFIEDSMKTKK